MRRRAIPPVSIAPVRDEYNGETGNKTRARRVVFVKRPREAYRTYHQFGGRNVTQVENRAARGRDIARVDCCLCGSYNPAVRADVSQCGDWANRKRWGVACC